MHTVTSRRGGGARRAPLPALLLLLPLALLACARGGEGGGGGGGGGKGGQGPGDGGGEAVSVDVREVRPGRLTAPLELVGTTQPVQVVGVRSRVEGQLERLLVDVGDRVTEGQELARVDPTLLRAQLNEVEAGLAGARAEVASAEAGVAQARSGLEQARLALLQARTEAQRYRALAQQGIASRQEAEQRATAERSAAQALAVAEQEVATRRSLQGAAAARVQAQAALRQAAEERLTFAVLRSPLRGQVMERLRAEGDLLQPGTEVLRLGDYARLEVVLAVPELARGQVQLGRQVPVRLDAYPDARLTGRVARQSPQADPGSRLVPVEVELDNPGGRIAAGLLARVELAGGGEERLLVLESALTAGRPPPPPSQGPGGGADGGAPRPPEAKEGAVFVATGPPEGARVEERRVQLGRRADGQVEVLSGLRPGERVVVRSAGELRPGAGVKLSALSEGAAPPAPAGPGAPPGGGGAGEPGRGGSGP